MIFITPIKEYFSFIYKGEGTASEYEYETRNERAYYDQHPDALDLELWLFFFNRFFAEEKNSKKISFLNHHLKTYQGDNRDFIGFVKKSPTRIPDDVLDINFRLFYESDFKEQVNEWLMELEAMCAGANLGSGPTDGRKRIKPKRMSLADIEKHFMDRLHTVSEETGKMIMTPEQVSHFLQANIEGFEPKVEAKKIRTGGNHKDVLGAVYDFYRQENPPLSPVEDYVRMAWDYFADLDHYKSYASCKSNFGKFSKL